MNWDGNKRLSVGEGIKTKKRNRIVLCDFNICSSKSKKEKKNIIIINNIRGNGKFILDGTIILVILGKERKKEWG